MSKKWILLIVLLGLVLRIVGLGSYPIGFTPDEASFGYDAISIIKTGKDQWGHTLPLQLESFGDFKAPLYSYILIPFVGILGLTKTAVRLPNAILASISIYIVYLLVIEIGDYKKKVKESKLKITGSIAAILLTTSSWHIMMSRGGFEANLTTLFMPLGILLFLRGLENPRQMLLSSVVLGLNMFTYHSARFVTPLVFLSLLVIFQKRLRANLHKYYLLSVSVFSIFLLLNAYTFFSGGSARATDISIYSGALEAGAEERISAMLSGVNPTVAKMFHNKFTVTGKRFATNYLSYFSFDFLFLRGPGEATYGMIPGRGVLYWFELPLLFGAVLYLFRRKILKPFLAIMVWLVIAPIPASLTTGVGQAANRAVIMLPAMQIFLAFGVLELYKALKNLTGKTTVRLALTAYIVVSFVFFLNFLEDYYFLTPRKSAQAMLYGRQEAVEYAKSVESDYNKIIVSKSLSEPHMYVAFFNGVEPKIYQEATKDWRRYRGEGLKFVDQLGEYSLGKYQFSSINYGKSSGNPSLLLIGKPEEFPDDALVLKSILYPNGDPAILIVDPDLTDYAYAL